MFWTGGNRGVSLSERIGPEKLIRPSCGRRTSPLRQSTACVAANPVSPCLSLAIVEQEDDGIADSLRAGQGARDNLWRRLRKAPDDPLIGGRRDLPLRFAPGCSAAPSLRSGTLRDPRRTAVRLGLFSRESDGSGRRSSCALGNPRIVRIQTDRRGDGGICPRCNRQSSAVSYQWSSQDRNRKLKTED